MSPSRKENHGPAVPIGWAGPLRAATARAAVPLLTAVKLMYAGAVLSALSLIVIVVSTSKLRAAIRRSDPTLSPSGLHTAQTAAVTIAVVVAVVGTGLWIWMARENRAGKRWARVTASMIFGLDTAAVLANFTRPDPLPNRLFPVVIWLIGLTVIVLLWRRGSSVYYSADRAP